MVSDSFWLATSTVLSGLLRWLSGKESVCQYRGCRFDPWVGKIPWRMKRQPIRVFLPGKSHGQRSLVGYSPWGRKELDMTEQLSVHPPFFQCLCMLLASDSLWPHGLYSLPGSSVHGIFQARIREWVAISPSRGSSWPRNWTQVFCIAGGCFTNWTTREALLPMPKTLHLGVKHRHSESLANSVYIFHQHCSASMCHANFLHKPQGLWGCVLSPAALLWWRWIVSR